MIKNLNIKELAFTEVKNDGAVFRDLNFLPSGSLKINDSGMSECSFRNIDLSRAEVGIKGSTIVGALLAAIRWPKNIQADREVFNQLKHAYDKNANYFEANRFYARELDAYAEEKDTPYKERFTFCVSRLVSDHGQNWVRALVSYMVVGLFFFLPFMALFGPNLIENYLAFINPVKVLPPENYSPGWWAVYKSLSAVVLYHLIVSFRRLTRR